MLVEYVNDGGTLIVLPSAPGGAILRELLKPLGPEEFIPGTSTLRFANGSTAAAIGGVYAVTPDEKSGVTVFARNAGDRIVGARFQHGKGRILFFGADLSRWVFPPDTHLMEGGVVSGKTPDFPENLQYSARRALPALMNVAGINKKVSVVSLGLLPRARDAGIYATELLSDRGSHRFETRTETSGAYGFVGLTNFSIHQPRGGQIIALDPRSENVEHPSKIRLPEIRLGERESLLLPLRVPLAAMIPSAAAGLDPADEVYYSTSELTGATYDGSSLTFDFNAPSDGEIALRLAHRPQRAQLDGKLVKVEQTPQHLLVVKIPKGPGPEFRRTVVLECRSAQPRIVFDRKSDWIVGETNAVRMTIRNPRRGTLAGVSRFERDD